MSRANILLVDDNPANLLALRSIIDDLDQNLVEARSGEEALQRLQSDAFAVVLLDVHMPGIDGFETARLIRKQERAKHTPIIFLTANDSEAPQLEQAYSLGAVDFLIKPIVPVILKAKVTGFVAIFEEKEQARREADQLRSLINGTTDYAIFLLDPQGNIVSWNAGATRIKQYQEEEIIGQHFSRFYPQEAIDRGWPAHELRTAEAVGHFEDEGWRVRKDGSRFWANVIITALRDEAGKLRGFSKITRDMTERKKAEENALRLAEEATARRVAEENARLIQEQRERLRVTLASIGDAVISTDAQSRITFLNPVAESLVGWKTQEAAGQTLSDVFHIVNEDTRQPVENPALRALRDGKIVGLANHTILISREGIERPIDDCAAPITDTDGTVIGSVLVFRDVTEQRRAEQQLRKSEARKSAILEIALDCIITMDHEGNVVEFNTAAEKTFGYRRAEVIGQPLADFIIPRSLRAQHYKGLNHYLATGEGPVLGKRFELPALRADGSEFTVELAITRIPTEVPPLFTAHLRDINERIRAEQHRSARFAVTQILNQAPGMPEAVTEVLRAVCESLGWEIGFFWAVDAHAEALVCKTCWHRPDALITEFETASFSRRLQRGQGLPGRVWSDGKPAWVLDVLHDANFPRAASAAKHDLHSAFACPIVVGGRMLGIIEFFSKRIREPDADLLDMMTTVAGNIGQFIERKTTEEQIKESEEQLRLLANTIPQLAWMARPDGHIFWYNRRWYEYTGTTPEQMEGWGWQSVHDPDVLPKVLQQWKSSIATGGAFDMVFPLKGADNTYRPFLTRINPLRDKSGHLLYWFGTNTDISDMKRLEDALRDADRRKDEFLATLAHELRNPLAPIRNSLQILKMARVDAATAQQTRDIMERQVHHLVRLVDDLLDVSRVMRGKIELRREPVEFATIIARAVETAKPLIEVQRHQFDISVPPESLLLDADPVRLAQVVGNLLTNSAKYTEANGHIWLEARREENQAILKIRDTGIGIAPDMLPHIFELFVQADHASTKAQGGLGIGLTLVKNLVEMHNGRVEAHSAGLGKGCEFVVRLPLMVTLVPEPGTNENAEQNQAITTSCHRLLVVDDNHDAAISLSALLRLQGYEVRVAHDGPTALEIATTQQPELILLDIGMPGMDGYEVARRLRQQPGLEKVVLAALTGWGQQEDRRRSAEAGFDHHLVKPPEPKALESLLAHLKAKTGKP